MVAWSDLHMDPENTTLPLVEIFETVEGEGTAAGYPTIFVRLFGCPLRCAWCDTPYSYAPSLPEFSLSIQEICKKIDEDYSASRICLTGGEPLMYQGKSLLLLNQLAQLSRIVDIHVETSGAVALDPFLQGVHSDKVRYIMDFKLPGSGETERMQLSNLELLRPQDELKFVIASDEDFSTAIDVLRNYSIRCIPLFSPVWDKMAPHTLVKKMLAHKLSDVKLSLQIHKVIWDPSKRGV